MVNQDLFNLFHQSQRHYSELFGEPENFLWSRTRGLNTSELLTGASLSDLEMARLQILEDENSVSEAYPPLESEPEMYLSFAGVGRESWLIRESQSEDVSRDEIRWSLGLTLRFGLLKQGAVSKHSFLNNLLFGDDDQVFPTVWDVMAEARMVFLVLEGHQFAKQGTPEIGQRYSSRRYKGFELDGQLFESIIEDKGGDPRDSAKSSREIGRMLEWGSNTLDQYKLRVAADIADLVNDHLEEEDVRSRVATSAEIHLPAPGKPEVSPYWTRKHTVNSLRGAIWVQVANHILNGSDLRKCENQICERGLFRVERSTSKQRYCDQSCKDSQNNRDKYKKRSKKNVRNNYD